MRALCISARYLPHYIINESVKVLDCRKVLFNPIKTLKIKCPYGLKIGECASTKAFNDELGQRNIVGDRISREIDSRKFRKRHAIERLLICFVEAVAYCLEYFPQTIHERTSRACKITDL